MKNYRRAAAALTLSLGTLLCTALPAGADTAMAGASAPPIDCSKAMSMTHDMAMMPADHGMMAGDHAMASPAASDATTTVDAGYTQLMLATLKHIDEMAKIEMSCGKDAAMKAQAKKDAAAAEREMQSFIHIPSY